VGWLRTWKDRPQPRVDRLELTAAAGDSVVLTVAGPDFTEVGDAPLDGEISILFRLREGRITHMHDYRRREDALAAAAEPPPPLPERERVADLGPPPPERARVVGLVPFVQVADVARSAGFYRLLGFDVCETYAPAVRLGWAFLEHGEARLMLARAWEPVQPERQAVLFYLYSHDLAGLREHLLAHGVAAGEIVDGTPGPKEEMRVADPDGYALVIAQVEEDRLAKT